MSGSIVIPASPFPNTTPVITIALYTGSNLITAANFCLQGRFAVVGTYDGRCIFYETEVKQYTYHYVQVTLEYTH